MTPLTLSIQGYMKIKGSSNYNATQRAHQRLRSQMATKLEVPRMVEWITIKEYADYVGISETEVRNCLNSK